MSDDERRTALVVEDDETVREYLGVVLKDLGFEVHECAQGQDFLQRVESLDPDLILLDLGLPDRDGTALLEELRSSSTRADVPVIIVTGDDSVRTLSRALSSGADEYLIKPISSSELRWRIKGILRLNRYRRRLQEVEARVRAEEEREGLQALIRGISEAPGMLFVRLDDSGTVVEANDAFRQRYLPTTRSFFDAVHPADTARFERAVEKLVDAPTVSLPVSGNLLTHAGALVPVRGMVTGRAGSHGDLGRLIVLLESILPTIDHQLLDQVGMSEEFIHLAAGAAHDLRNLLGVVELQVGLLEMDPSQEELDLTIKSLKGVSQEARHLTGLLTSQVRKAPTPVVPTDLRGALEEMQPYLRTALPRRIALVIEVAEGLRCAAEPTVISMDPIDLRRVLLNLLVNARDAIRGTGTIKLQLRLTTDEPGGVVIEVRDTGNGIPPDVLPRIFDPLFTTKPLGSGTGLGLPIVQALVKKASGYVEVDSVEGGGTCFRLHLPTLATPRESNPISHDF